MERNWMQQTWVRILTTVITAAIMILIFFFSMETADRSDQTSGKVSRIVIKVTHPDYQRKPKTVQKTIYDKVQHLVRKSAHFTEYMILGIMLRLCLESWFDRRRWLIPAGWAVGTLYAGTDEIHQLLIDGRSGQLTDVVLDSCGVLTGVLIISLILTMIMNILKSRKGKEASSDGILQQE